MADVERARELAQGALLSLERNRRRIDDLNVYPVPDGDTGTNLMLTVRPPSKKLKATTPATADARERADARCVDGRARKLGRDLLADPSRLRRGVADAEHLDAPTLARAFRGASDAAYAR